MSWIQVCYPENLRIWISNCGKNLRDASTITNRYDDLHLSISEQMYYNKGSVRWTVSITDWDSQQTSDFKTPPWLHKDIQKLVQAANKP